MSANAGRASPPPQPLTEGELQRDSALEITSELTENAVLFGDGIEADRPHLDWGQHVRIGFADRHLTLVN